LHSQQPLTFGDARTALNPDFFKVFVEIVYFVVFLSMN
jgi:hypothetical protein